MLFSIELLPKPDMLKEVFNEVPEFKDEEASRVMEPPVTTKLNEHPSDRSLLLPNLVLVGVPVPHPPSKLKDVGATVEASVENTKLNIIFLNGCISYILVCPNKV